jgi:DNA-directed RNA polymerase specialized sigma24 family protein
MTDARQKLRAAYTRWSEEDARLLASEAARNRTVEELAELLGRKPSAIQSRLRRLKLRD